MRARSQITDRTQSHVASTHGSPVHRLTLKFCECVHGRALRDRLPRHVFPKSPSFQDAAPPLQGLVARIPLAYDSISTLDPSTVRSFESYRRLAATCNSFDGWHYQHFSD